MRSRPEPVDVIADRSCSALSGAPPDDFGAGRLMTAPVPKVTGCASPPVNV
jgi:hypothetical protein